MILMSIDFNTFFLHLYFSCIHFCLWVSVGVRCLVMLNVNHIVKKEMFAFLVHGQGGSRTYMDQPGSTPRHTHTDSNQNLSVIMKLKGQMIMNCY